MTLAQARPADRDATLLRAATALFCQEPTHDRDGVRRFEQLAIHLLPKLKAADRGYVASLLSGRKDAPPAVMRVLARDVFEVASPVLRFSSTLSTIELLGVIAATGPDHHQLIASRSDLSPDVLRALDLARQKQEAVEEVAPPELAADENPPVSLEADRPVEDAIPTIPNEPSPSEFSAFLDAPLEDRLRMLREAASRDWRPPDAKAAGRLDEVLRRSRATAQIVVSAKRRDREGLVAAFAQSLGITSATATKLIQDPSGEPLVLMVRAAGLSDADGRTVLLLANARISESVDAFFRLADLYASLEPKVAEAFIDAWRPQKPKRPSTHQPVYSERPERRIQDRARTETSEPKRRSSVGG